MNNTIQDMLIGRLCQRIDDLQAVYLFGSQARAQSRAGSDVDIAVLADESLDTLRRFELSNELADILHQDVDMVDLRSASTVMRAQVIGKGQRLYGEGAALEEFEDRVFSDYARLNEARAGILADVRERGSIYGR